METRETTTNESQARQKIDADHRELAGLVDRLEKTTDPAQLLPLLYELREKLAEHFEEEEAEDGLHEIVGSTAPHLLTSVQRVFDEHREFLNDLDTLSTRTRALVDGPLAEICQGAVALCDKLRQHEAREAELLSSAVYTDLGRSS